MTSYAEFKRLPAQERDELGFAKWQECSISARTGRAAGSTGETTTTARWLRLPD